jgi:hypothetical protein
MGRPWWTPLAGVLFVVLLIASFVVGGEPPDFDDPAAEIVEHYVDNEGSIIAGAILSGLAAATLIFFAGIFRRVLRAAEGENGTLSLVAFAGALMIAVGGAFDATLSFAIVESADDIEPTSVQTLQALWDNDFMPLAVGNLVFLLASGLSILRHAAVSKWFGWVAVVVAVLSITPVGFVAFVVAALWVIVLSIVLTLQARAEGGTAPPPPPAATMPA